MESPTPASPTNTAPRRRGTSLSSAAHGIQSVSHTFISAAEHALESDPPPGFLAATAQEASRVPPVRELRRGSARSDDFPAQGGNLDHTSAWERTSRGSKKLRGRPPHGHEHYESTLSKFPALSEEPTNTSTVKDAEYPSAVVSLEQERNGLAADTPSSVHQPNDRKLPWTATTWYTLRVYAKWVCTPFGLLITIYGLNVVAWGGMLFLLLCDASKAMCWVNDDSLGWHQNCNDLQSPRRKWIEIDSQILNALFCVTGFGLAPWRFRDLYYLLSWRFTNEQKAGKEQKLWGLRKLAGHYRGWMRLPDSDELDTTDAALHSSDDLRIPLPASKKPNEPLTGVRSSPTPLWKVDVFVWCQVWNTFFQCCLCAFMWGFNRFDRPSWSTGLFVALACGIVAVGGLVSYYEGRRINRIEGAPPSAAMQMAHCKMKGNEDGEFGPILLTTTHESVSVHAQDKSSAKQPAN